MIQIERLRAAFPDLLVALDFDGPIAPIVDEPDSSRPVASALPTLSRLAGLGVHIAIVTGRDVETLLRLSGLRDIPDLQVMGVHGAQRWADGVLTQIEPPPAMHTLRRALPGLVSRVDGDLWIEDKELSLVVHARRSRAPARSLAHLRALIVDCVDAEEIGIHDGKLILELRVPGIDKGGALETLLDDLCPSTALFAGDDYGDLPAFAALRAWSKRTERTSLGVAVGDLDAARAVAGHHCDDATSLMALLNDISRGGRHRRDGTIST